MNIAGHQLLLFPPSRPLAERFGAEFFRAVPESPGVYLMSTAREGVLYVGKAKNLRRRLSSYRSGTGERLPRRLLRLVLSIERIDWDVCADEAAALARERELIRTLQPRFNSVGVRPPKKWFIGWCRGRGTLSLGLVESPGAWTEIRGPFIHARPAFAALMRSLWRILHPGASVAQMPSPLLHGMAPARWSVPWSERVGHWLTDLESFLAGHESALVPRTGEAAPPATEPARPLAFDEQWQVLDAECLIDFHQRLSTPATLTMSAK